MLQAVRKTGAKKCEGGIRYIEEMVIPMIRKIRKSPTKEAFKTMSDAAIKKFEDDHEYDFANYFEQFYLSERWCGWYVGNMPITNLGFTNNAMESANAKIKKLVSDIPIIINAIV